MTSFDMCPCPEARDAPRGISKQNAKLCCLPHRSFYNQSYGRSPTSHSPNKPGSTSVPTHGSERVMETDTVRRPHRCAGKNKQKGSSDPGFIFWGTGMSFNWTQAGGSQGRGRLCCGVPCCLMTGWPWCWWKLGSLFVHSKRLT